MCIAMMVVSMHFQESAGLKESILISKCLKKTTLHFRLLLTNILMFARSSKN